MDPLTHILAGAAVSDVIEAPNARHAAALPFAATLAALPDIDVLPAFLAAFPRNPFSSAGLFDMDVMRAMHRGVTHALPVLLAFGAAAALVIWLATGRKRAFPGWLLLAETALLSHIILDMCNGPVQLWRPFSDAWVGWGQSPEADPLVLAALGVNLLANHPPKWQRGGGLATVRLLENTGEKLHQSIRSRLSARATAILALAAAFLVIAARIALG